jgi:5'-nucleotidase
LNYDGGVHEEPGPFIQTLSGRRVNPLDASPEDIDAGDIARALANTCRFGGHSRAFYSVAQHSAIVCDLLEERGATPDELMAALLHDASEAYLGDLPHPLKHRSELGAAFRVAEKRLEAVIAERFALPDAAARIKPLDRALLATERRIFSEVRWHWPELDGVEPLELAIEPWAPARAQEEFTRRFERIEALRRNALTDR